jgi:pseudouridine-5'-phosphate glycosidase
MPAFYTRESSFFCDAKINTIEELANIVAAKWDLKVEGGLVVANPVPEALVILQEKLKTSLKPHFSNLKDSASVEKILHLFS